MIRLRRGSLAVLLAVVILVCSVCPVRVRAVSVGAGLVAVAGAVAITAYLNASGIYPFDGSLDNYRSGLASLLDSYNSGVAANRTVTEEVIKAYLVNGAIAIAKDSWERLRSFTSWIASEFGLTDNQIAIPLSIASAVQLPVLPASPPTVADLQTYGLSGLGNASDRTLYVGASVSDVYIVIRAATSYARVIPFVSVSTYDNTDFVAYSIQTNASGPLGIMSTADKFSFTSRLFSADGVLLGYYYLGGVGQIYNNYLDHYVSMGISVVDTSADMEAYMIGVLSGAIGGDSVVVDTGDISIPDALPEDAQFGGLAVPGVSAVTTVQALEGAVEQGVTDRAKPGVRVVDVTVAEGVEVDTVTGEITDVTPVEISPSAVLPAVSDFSLPADISQGFQSKFPFSLGFTALRFITPLNKDPVAPKIRWTFSIPILSGDTQYVIEVDLAPWNDIALICRAFQTIIIWVGFSLSCRKFLFL